MGRTTGRGAVPAFMVLGLALMLLSGCGGPRRDPTLPSMDAAETLRVLGPLARPVSGRITSPYGMRTHPVTGKYRMHTGVDMEGVLGTPIVAAADGVVDFAGWFGDYGNTVIIKHVAGYDTLYGHCHEMFVNPGQQVRQGAVIAMVGRTGNATGPHLHFELRLNGRHMDPAPHLPGGF